MSFPENPFVNGQAGFFNAPIDRGVNKIGSETLNSLNGFSKNIFFAVLFYQRHLLRSFIAAACYFVNIHTAA